MSGEFRGLSAAAADWAASRSFGSYDDAVIEVGRQGVIDTIAVAVAGGRHRTARTAASLELRGGAPGVVTEFVTGRSRDPVTAAFVNGVAAHVLDYDDSAVGELVGHPSAVVFPAVWSAVQSRARYQTDLLHGYITGVEGMMRFAAAYGGGGVAYRQGFHTTTHLGVLGATLGAAAAVGASRAVMQRAIELAGCFSSGVRAAFGTAGKAIQVGHAAAAALDALTLAEAGLGGGSAMLDTPDGVAGAIFGDVRGVDAAPERARAFQVVEARDRSTGDGAQATLDEFAHEAWIVSPGVRRKLFPACRGTHRIIEAALAIRRRLLGLEEELRDISSIQLDVAPELREIVTYSSPSNGLEAKFSLEYCAVVALLDGRVGLAQFADERVNSDDVGTLLKKVVVCESQTLPTWREPFRPDRVLVTTKSGARVDEVVSIEIGHPQRPLSRQQMVEKTDECLRHRFPSLEEDALNTVARELAAIALGSNSSPRLPALAKLLATCYDHDASAPIHASKG